MKKLLLIPLLCICIVSNATNYYVRSGGSDSSTGLSDAAAWASVAKVNSSMSLFKPGDAILFRRGDTWTNVTILIGIGGVQGNNITLGAYGSGAKPIISAPNANPAIKVTAANRGYWTIDNLDLRSTGIPSSSYSTLAIQHSYWLTDMGPVPGWIIQNCTFNACVMLSGPNTLVRNNIFNGSLNANNRGGAITFRGAECKNVIVENNDISNYYDRGIWIYNGGSAPVFRYNKISNIKKGADHGGSGINVDGYGLRVTYGEIYGNYISNIDMFAITFENGYYASVYNNKTDNGGGVMIWQYPVNGDGSNYAGTGNMDIHHNVFHNGNIGIVLYNAASMKIANNDFVKDNTASTNEGALLVSGSSTYVSGISFVNNIISGTWPHGIKLPDTKNIWSSFDYNDITPVGSEIVNAGGSSQSIAQLQSSGYMTHGITSNPLFVSATSDWKLQQSSPAINKGTSLGYTSDFDGRTIDAQPDMGAFEYAGIVQTPVSPVYSGSVIQNTSPSVLEMTYNMTLANIVPATTAFSVTVNSVARTVSTVTISGSKVLLNLSSPVKSGEVVNVAYTKPSTNPLQSTLGGIAESIGAQPVTNNITATIVAPQFVSAAIQNAAPSVLEMTYNMTLANIVPATTSFSVTVNSTARTVSSVAVSGSIVKLTLSSAVKAGETVTVAYTKPATNPLQTTGGGQAESLTAKPVTNNVTATVVVPQFVSAAVQNATPSLLEMTYNMSLASILPGTTAFTVMVNSTSRTVSSVAVSGSIVKLTLSSAVKAGETVTVAYTKPATNPLQTTGGAQAESLTAKPVTNNVTATVVPQFVSAAVQNATPSLLEMTYNMSLASILPGTTAFTVMVNSTSRTVSSVAVSGSVVKLTLASPVKAAETVTVAYTKPATNPLQTTDGGQAESLTTKPVTNNVTSTVQVSVPQLTGATVSNETPAIIDMSYDMALSNIVPPVSAFSVKINSVNRIVSSVSVSGSTVRLTLVTQAFYGDTIKVSYTKPAENQIQNASGAQAASFTAHPVTNNVAKLTKGNISISPNPAKSFINVTVREAITNAQTIRIYDLDGVLKKEAKLNPDKTRIDLNLVKGFYVVRILSGEIILYTQKLIIL